jgi:hypothetical protein
MVLTTESNIDKKPATLEEIRNALNTGTLNSIREVLPDRAVEAACRAAGWAYRKRLIPPVVVVLHMILAAIWPEESFAASWQVVWDTMVSRLPHANGRSPGSGTLAKARARVPLSVWKDLFDWLAEQAAKLSAPFDKWRGLRVVLLDGTTVSMPDEGKLFAAFGRGSGKHGLYKYPLARLVTLVLANTQAIIAYALGRYDEAENTLAWQILGTLRPGDLLVGDRRYAAAHFYARYLAQGVDYLTRMNERLKVRKLKVFAVYADGSFAAGIKINKKYRKADPTLPEFVTARIIQVAARIRGKRTVLWLVTSLLDPDRYPAAEIAALYLRRWRIETLFRNVKVELGADVLRSKTPDGIRKEVAARLVALNVIRSIILQAAGEHGADPLRLSFVHAVRAILSFAPALATEPPWKLPLIYRALLCEIASHQNPVRAGRIERRAIRRERKHYPTLRTTRLQWRLSNAA